MSTSSTRGRDTRGRGRGRRGARAESLASDTIPVVDASETLASPTTDSGTRPYDRMTGDDALSQAMLLILERVARPNTGTGGRGSVSERLQSNRAEVFRGISRVAPNVAEYWLEATERIIDDLDCTAEQKLKGAISLLREEAYQWWLTVKEGTQLKRITWEFFKSAFQGKYVGASYVDARRKEFLNLTQGDRIVATEYERCVRFEDGLRDSLRVLIAPQRERDFAVLVEKAKIAEDVKRTECQSWEKKMSKNKIDLKPSNSDQRHKKSARADGPVRAEAPVAAVRLQPCVDYGKSNYGEYWKRIEACLRYGSMEHHLRECHRRPDYGQTTGTDNIQPPRGGQQPARGRSNGMGRGRGAPDRGMGHAEARQPALVYAACRREDGDAPEVDVGTYFSHAVLFT
ncbi:uncharacterized protein [Gossypium hirsutum]|uniref:Retrotransposon gag domain-containing protein n=1 Tax=Gossypium hirsutum TaxID=3635 RepID=A0A1U8IDT5_GOSHI|nr:uncharacterized protein LOC107895603 [Gossypium hirsutum]